MAKRKSDLEISNIHFRKYPLTRSSPARIVIIETIRDPVVKSRGFAALLQSRTRGGELTPERRET
jgi:hypothetical protein